ncbi:MAG: hypothetical protein KBH93_03840 [Anaerolineae bacterium]|nr:hypothetical protein [Anaerolineae bacterium]
MADLISHIEQARHNEECANFLLENAPEFRDWAITAAFYAAVHLVEACFTSRRDIGHTETARDRAQDEEKHRYRARKVRELARGAYDSYKDLYEASSNVRYLTKPIEYYDQEAAQKFVRKHLLNVRTELEKAFGLNLK